MNKWQMEGRTIKSKQPGSMIDDRDKRHYTIHPMGRRDSHKAKQRLRKVGHRLPSDIASLQ